MNNQTPKPLIGTVIERKVRIGSTSFPVQVLGFDNINSCLVLNTNGQTVETEPFMPYIENMIKEPQK